MKQMKLSKRILTLLLSILMLFHTLLGQTELSTVYAASLFDLELTLNDNQSITANWSQIAEDVHYSVLLTEAGAQDFFYSYEPSLGTTSYTTIANLPDGVPYTMLITAYRNHDNSILGSVRKNIQVDAGKISNQEHVQATMPMQSSLSSLPTPTNLTEEVSASSVSVHWDAVEGATGYVVEVRKINDPNKMTYSVTETSTDLFGLVPFTNYLYTVRAENADGLGTPAIGMFLTPFGLFQLLSVPSMPTVSAEATETSVTISWNPVGNGIQYDLVFNGVSYNGLTETSHIITNLEPNSSYSYQIRAGNWMGFSEYTEEAFVQTIAPPPAIPENI